MTQSKSFLEGADFLELPLRNVIVRTLMLQNTSAYFQGYLWNLLPPCAFKWKEFVSRNMVTISKRWFRDVS